MNIKLDAGWKQRLSHEFEKNYFIELVSFVKHEYATQMCFPPGPLIFSAFDHCLFDNLKVVILGQDPYHGMGQANGLCFSVNDGTPTPPSLKNVFKEMQSDLGKAIPASGNLARWANQGVLLLNATLTVRANSAGSHQKRGWEIFTDSVVKLANDEKEGLVFILWGNYAQQKGALLDSNKHLVLKSAHPSPFSVERFYGNHHFSKCNAYLKSRGKAEIDW